MCTKQYKPALYEDERWLKSRDDTLTTSASTANFNAAVECSKIEIEGILRRNLTNLIFLLQQQQEMTNLTKFDIANEIRDHIVK